MLRVPGDQLGCDCIVDTDRHRFIQLDNLAKSPPADRSSCRRNSTTGPDGFHKTFFPHICPAHRPAGCPMHYCCRVQRVIGDFGDSQHERRWHKAERDNKQKYIYKNNDNKNLWCHSCCEEQPFERNIGMTIGVVQTGLCVLLPCLCSNRCRGGSLPDRLPTKPTFVFLGCL